MCALSGGDVIAVQMTGPAHNANDTVGPRVLTADTPRLPGG